MKDKIDLTGVTITYVAEGVSGKRMNYFCIDHLTGKTKTANNKDRAIAYCRKYWKGGNWEVIEHEGKFVKDGDKVIATSNDPLTYNSKLV